MSQETIKSAAACKIWSRFEAKKKDGSVIKLRFQQLPPERKLDAMEFALKYTVRDEAFHKAADIMNSENALAEYKKLLVNIYKYDVPHTTICCVDDGTTNGGELAGLSVVKMCERTDTEEDIQAFINMFKTAEMKNLFHIIAVSSELCSFEKQFEKHFGGRGITVHPDYRKLGICNEFVRLRKISCVEDNVDMTCAWMTSIGSQRAAEKNNWKVAYEITPDELGKLTGLHFDSTVSTYKYMYTTKE